MDCLLSSDIIRETAQYLEGQDMPLCCLVCPAWAETIMPLIQFTIYQNLQKNKCSSKLFIEKDMGSMINVSLLNEGYAALSSGIDGNGKLMICTSPSVSNNQITDDDSNNSKSVITSNNNNDNNMMTSLNFSSNDEDRKVIGFVEVSSSIYGIVVGNFGYGAKLNKWNSNNGQSELLSEIELEYSDTVAGRDPLSHSDQALFKCRAVHYFEVTNQQQEGQEGDNVNQLVSKKTLIRVLVHNPFLASNKKGLIASWDIETGKFESDYSLIIDWDESHNGEATTNTNTFPGEPNTLRDDSKRFGGISCACYYEMKGASGLIFGGKKINENNSDNSENNASAENHHVNMKGGISSNKHILVTGHQRDINGKTKIHLYDALTGELYLTLYGPTLLTSTSSFSTSGILSLSLTSEYIVASCCDGRIHCFDLKTGYKVAVLSDEGIVAGITDLSTSSATSSSTSSDQVQGGLLDSDILPPSRKTNNSTCQTVTVSSTGYIIAAFQLNSLSKLRINSNNNHMSSQGSKGNKKIKLELFQLRKNKGILNINKNQNDNGSNSGHSYSTDLSIIHCGTLPDPLTNLTCPETLQPKMNENLTNNNNTTDDNVNNVEISENVFNNATSSSSSGSGGDFVDGSKLKVNKIAMDLERRGKVIIACSLVGSEELPLKGYCVNGFLAEYDFLKI